MSIEVIFLFILACIVLAITPGPSMSLILANSTRDGSHAGVMTVIGNASGLVILVSIATLGMTSLMVFLAEWFDWIRWVGAAYLVWLGINRIKESYSLNDLKAPVIRKRLDYYRQGMFISLSNPKVLLFLGAFFPQFVSQDSNVAVQLATLAVTFVVSVTLIDLGMAIMTSKVVSLLSQSRQRLADRVVGVLLICGGIWLAFARKS